VLRGERRKAVVSVTLVDERQIRALNRHWLGRDALTDVIAFPLSTPGNAVLGDVYICVAAARLQAREFGVPLREELRRLVVHGTLHILGYDHPDGAGRERSTMWRRQEHYVKALA